MPKPICRRPNGESGFTLIEAMTGLALAGVVFAIVMGLLTQSAKFSTFFNGTATSIEGVNEALTVLNAVMPQVVRVRQCGCRGTASTAQSNCTWSDSQPWYNPVLNAAASNIANGNLGVLLLDGDYEDYFGGDNTVNTSQLRTPNIATLFSGFYTKLGNCETYSTVSSSDRRGCKRRVRLFYNAPTLENAASSSPANASVSGRLTLMLGGPSAVTESTVSLESAVADTGVGVVTIGARTRFGADGLGLTELSCGFVSSSGGVAGLLFALNFKVKARSTTLQVPNHRNYESWYPNSASVSPTYNANSGMSGKNYEAGVFRDIRLKYSFRNVGTRGVYGWKSQNNRYCKPNGYSFPGSDTPKVEECCSLAISGRQCVGCKAGGVAATTATECCSEKKSGANCL